MKADRLARGSTLLALALLLAGCSLLPRFGFDKPAPGAPESFELQGRVLVRYSTQAFSGSIRWRHAQALDEVWLSGPIGQTAVHIERDSSGATLTTADQRIYRAVSLDELTRSGLGWTLPLADLSFYVLGQLPPEAADALVTRDAQGRLLGVTHAGWEVALTPPVAPRAPAVPLRLRMLQGDIEIRLVIDQLEST